jgi:cytoskeleton protein RodZ
MDSEEPQQPAVGEPAGQQLKRAREKLGLSVKDVADAQHLRFSIIQAIEDGNYDQIDSELFLKGYVRAYAKQVGADADALIQSLDLELEPLRRERAKQELENPLVDIERRRMKKRRVAKALIIIIILGGAALAAWKLVLEPRLAIESQAGQAQPEAGDESAGGANSETNGVQSLETEKSSELREGEELEVSSADVATAGSEQDSGLADGFEPADSPEQTTTSLDPAGEPVPAGSTEPGESPEQAESPVFAEAPTAEPGITVGSNPQGTDVVDVEPVVQPDPVFEESAQPEAVAAPTRLEMSFESDCWVQVTDSSGARLVASLQRNGDQISVSGRAPFNVVIGAVDAVDTMSFGGEPVNLSDFRVVNNRTEFTLTL